MSLLVAGMGFQYSALRDVALVCRNQGLAGWNVPAQVRGDIPLEESLKRLRQPCDE
ncbi:MAG TPA: hypothetical protein VFP59_05325 [Candidatus Angelobacter sp.]|nr:hypothetical protein [Candidatus Angelobacter sp.]